MPRRQVVLAVAAALLMVVGLSLDSFVQGAAARDDDPAGSWAWPLSPQPEVVTGFDPPQTPYGPGHVGVDLLGRPGQPVTSVAAGTVAFAGQVAGIPVVVVGHRAERSTYQPVVRTVSKGDVVVAGQLLGTLSNVRGHCLPLTCLHLGRVAGEIYLDPLELLGGGPVRLLPRGGGGAPPAEAATEGTMLEWATPDGATREGATPGRAMPGAAGSPALPPAAPAPALSASAPVAPVLTRVQRPPR